MWMNMMYGMPLGPNHQRPPGWLYGPYQAPMVASQGYVNQMPAHSSITNHASPPAHSGHRNPTPAPAPAPLPQQTSYQAPLTSHQSGPPPVSNIQRPSSSQLQVLYPASEPSAASVSTSTGGHSGNYAFFTDASSSNHSYTPSRPRSFDMQRPSAGPSTGPSAGSSITQLGNSSMLVLNFAQRTSLFPTDEEINAALAGDRFGEPWEPWEKNIIITYWVGPQSPSNLVSIALDSLRTPRAASQLGPQWLAVCPQRHSVAHALTASE